MPSPYALAFQQRAVGSLVFICGVCDASSKLSAYQAPAILSLQDAAALHRCPECGLRSSSSKIEEL
jgi:hypothetical protein